MPEIIFPQEEGDPVVVNLRDPYWAAFLAWLFPGAGHFYQRRYAKGTLFLICVLTTFVFGMSLGHGRVVYASSKSGDFRWQYGLQAATGIIAMPAMVQAFKTQKGNDPYFVLCERFPPKHPREFEIIPDEQLAGFQGKTLKDGFMAPPAGPIYVDTMDVLGKWHFDYKHFYEMGTLYTVVAGLLNLLAIYDAFCGPAILTPAQKEEMEKRRNRKRGEGE